MLSRYVAFTKAMAEISRKLRKSMTYPAILIVASAILILVLTTFVIPNFAQLYGSVGKAREAAKARQRAQELLASAPPPQ